MLNNGYNFHKQLLMSEGTATSDDVREVLLAKIPGALRVEKATKTEDRSGTDWWVVTESGQRIGVDVKVRDTDYRSGTRKDDLCLEAYSNTERQTPGWTRDPNKQTDYVLYWWKPTRRWALLPFRLLCAVYQRFWKSWMIHYFTSAKTATTDSCGRILYHTTCSYVDRRTVWAEIYKEFGGDQSFA